MKGDSVTDRLPGKAGLGELSFESGGHSHVNESTVSMHLADLSQSFSLGSEHSFTTRVRGGFPL